MARKTEGVLLSQDALERISRVVRYIEGEWGGGDGPRVQEMGVSQVGEEAGIVQVVITGPRRAILGVNQPDPTTSTTSTSGTGTGTTAPPILIPSSTTTTTTTAGRMAYTGFFIYRNHEPEAGEDLWITGEPCYVEELNGLTLGIGCRYDGMIVGTSNDLYPIVMVGNQGRVLSCGSATTTTTTTTGCAGSCEYTLDEMTGEWVLDEDSGCGENCGCPWPDFCPPDGGCAKTTTYCAPGFVQPDAQLYLCTTTTTGTGTTGTTAPTSATTVTTTSTPDPTDCGTGCIYKFVTGVGTFLYSNDCDVGKSWTLSDGSVCTCFGCGSGGPDEGAGPCNEVAVPCNVICIPPPPPPTCAGQCKWVWPSVPGVGWVRVQDSDYTCQGSPGYECECFPPSEDGSECLQTVLTPCFHPVPPTTTGTGTTSATGTTGSTSATTATTSTTPGGCRGTCVMRWDNTSGVWYPVADCGPNCLCTDPPYDGVDDCDVAKTACQTTTSTSTTSTSSTTTTTTTTPPCNANCTWQCEDTGGAVYEWVLETPCPIGCGCKTPREPCNGGNAGKFLQDMPCSQECDCGSPGSYGKCCWQCNDFDGVPFWELTCAEGCPVGTTCYPDGVMPLCTLDNLKDVYYSDCKGARPTTSATTSTTTTSGPCGGEVCVWRCLNSEGVVWELIDPCSGPCGCFFPPNPEDPCTFGAITTTPCFMP